MPEEELSKVKNKIIIKVDVDSTNEAQQVRVTSQGFSDFPNFGAEKTI